MGIGRAAGSVRAILARAAAAAAAAAVALAAPAAAQSAPATIDFNILHAQVILDRLGFAPGVLDGRSGLALTNALKGFQESRGMAMTGKLDGATLRVLHRYRALRPVRTLRVTADALGGPFVAIPDDPQAQAKLDRLGYRNALEKLAEMFHTIPAVLIALNSRETVLRPGAAIRFPNALPQSRAYPADLDAEWRRTLSDLNVDAVQPRGTRIVVDKSDGVLRVLDRAGKLVAQFTATMGSTGDPLPIGTWKLTVFDRNPDFHYNPELFWDVSDAKPKALLPPGPNGPVGVAWLDLTKEHYGIHGTPEPQTIGRAESHGCIRLTNWDVARLTLMVEPGTVAEIRE